MSTYLENADGDEAHWFVLRARPKGEHIAVAHLRQLPGVEAFCPRLKFRKTTRRGKVWFNEALFPGYVFARYRFSEVGRAVQYATAVRKLVDFGGKVPVVPEGVMEALIEQVGVEETAVLDAGVQVGDEVTVAEGAMRGLKAVVTRLMSGKERVQILLDFLGRQTLVELEERQLTHEGNPRELMERDGKSAEG